MHRKLTFGANGVRLAVLAGALAAASVLAVPSALSQGSGSTYTDPTGDNSSAGDITGVSITADSTGGQILFRLSGTNLGTSTTQATELFIDSDANPATGDLAMNGADYWFGVFADGYGFEHYDGQNWGDTPNSTVKILGSGSGLII